MNGRRWTRRWLSYALVNLLADLSSSFHFCKMDSCRMKNEFGVVMEHRRSTTTGLSSVVRSSAPDIGPERQPWSLACKIVLKFDVR